MWPGGGTGVYRMGRQEVHLYATGKLSSLLGKGFPAMACWGKKHHLHSYKKTLTYALQGSLINLFVSQGELQWNYVLIFGEKKIM